VERVEKTTEEKYSIVNELKTGDCFGEISLLTQFKRTATVYTISPTICCRVGKQEFLELVEAHSDLKNKLLKKITDYQDHFF